MIVYAVNCSPWLSDNKIEQSLPYLDDKRRSRIRRLRVPLKRAQCAAAGLLLTRILGENGVAPALTYGENGKPYLAHHPDTHFSITHTEKWVFLAVADCEIGIDAQIPRKVCPRLAARNASPEELTWVKEDTEPHFARLWTMKEAYLKYTGTGLSVPIRSITVSVPPTDGHNERNDCYWSLLNYEYISLSVCSANPIGNIRIETMKSLP